MKQVMFAPAKIKLGNGSFIMNTLPLYSAYNLLLMLLLSNNISCERKAN